MNEEHCTTDTDLDESAPLATVDRGNPLAAVLEEEMDRPGEQLLHRFCADFGRSMPEAIEVFAWMDENARPAHHAERDDALKQLNFRFCQALQCLVSYQQEQKQPHELRMSTRVTALMLGFNTVAGADCAAALGRKMKIHKATVNKFLNYFLQLVDMPNLPGQRGEDARGNMSASRIKQLDHQKTKTKYGKNHH